MWPRWHTANPQTSSFRSSKRRSPLARPIGSRAAKVALVTAIAVISTSAAAAAGILPQPVQSVVERAAQYVGWHLPERDEPATAAVDHPAPTQITATTDRLDVTVHPAMPPSVAVDRSLTTDELCRDWASSIRSGIALEPDALRALSEMAERAGQGVDRLCSPVAPTAPQVLTTIEATTTPETVPTPTDATVSPAVVPTAPIVPPSTDNTEPNSPNTEPNTPNTEPNTPNTLPPQAQGNGPPAGEPSGGNHTSNGNPNANANGNANPNASDGIGNANPNASASGTPTPTPRRHGNPNPNPNANPNASAGIGNANDNGNGASNRTPTTPRPTHPAPTEMRRPTESADSPTRPILG